MVSRSIITGIKNTQDVANRIGEGDLSQPIISVGSDEIAALMHSMDIMQQNLVQVVTGVRQSSDSVSTASAEIAQGNNDLSARTEQQASALEETAASMEQLAATVRNNADNAIEADRLAKASTMSAGACSDAVNLVAESMTEINEASKKIGDITTVINGIAFQTNILALNAAIEAARAGEHGRGFAVVATEVRSLAARSAEAAKEIKALIEASEEKVNQGVEHAQQTALQMNGVVVSIQKVAELITDISTATREQAAGIEQVGEAVTQMDTVTQQNAALVEEMAAAAQSLNQQADELVNQVAVFTINT
jgi:methyl-accepting chemotaxis protein